MSVHRTLRAHIRHDPFNVLFSNPRDAEAGAPGEPCVQSFADQTMSLARDFTPYAGHPLVAAVCVS
jgi:hypothetical protein